MVHWHRGLRWCVTTWDCDGALAQANEMVRYSMGLRWCVTTWDWDGALAQGTEIFSLQRGTEMVHWTGDCDDALQRVTEIVHWHSLLGWRVTMWDRDGELAQGTGMVRYSV